MSEFFKHYKQFKVADLAVRKFIQVTLQKAGYSLDADYCRYDHQYLVVNVVNKKGTWNCIPKHFYSKEVTSDLVAELCLLESVSVDAQVELLFCPV